MPRPSDRTALSAIHGNPATSAGRQIRRHCALGHRPRADFLLNQCTVNNEMRNCASEKCAQVVLAEAALLSSSEAAPLVSKLRPNRSITSSRRCSRTSKPQSAGFRKPAKPPGKPYFGIRWRYYRRQFSSHANHYSEISVSSSSVGSVSSGMCHGIHVTAYRRPSLRRNSARHNAANAQIGKKSALEPFSTPDWFDCDFRNSFHVNSLGHIRLRFG